MKTYTLKETQDLIRKVIETSEQSALGQLSADARGCLIATVVRAIVDEQFCRDYAEYCDFRRPSTSEADDVLDDEVITFSVVEGGITAVASLDDRQLVRLLRSPKTMRYLGDTVSQELPAAWNKPLADHSRRLQDFLANVDPREQIVIGWGWSRVRRRSAPLLATAAAVLCVVGIVFLAMPKGPADQPTAVVAQGPRVPVVELDIHGPGVTRGGGGGNIFEGGTEYDLLLRLSSAYEFGELYLVDAKHVRRLAHGGREEDGTITLTRTHVFDQTVGWDYLVVVLSDQAPAAEPPAWLTRDDLETLQALAQESNESEAVDVFKKALERRDFKDGEFAVWIQTFDHRRGPS